MFQRLIWTPGAWLGGFIKGTTRHCYTQNIKALGYVVSEMKIFLRVSHCKYMGADDPQGGAIFDPRGIIAKWFNTCDCCGNVLNLDIGIWQATEWVFEIFDFHNVFQFPPLILMAKVEPLHGKTNNLRS